MNNEQYNFGVLSYNSINIGDEIQVIAAERFLPRIDEYVLRDAINTFVPKNGKKTKLIMNAWWLWQKENFVPSDYVEPLMVSMHIRPEIRHYFSKNKKIMSYLKEHAPIGCRDMDTCTWLKSIGIPAYFSGCLTLTLLRNNNIPREDYILCVDVDKKVVDEIKTRTNRPVYSLTRLLSPYYTTEERIELAKLFLRLYHSAHCVVSPCLHAILPSLALQTPALRIIEYPDVMSANSRFSGFEECCYGMTGEDLIKNKNAYNFDNPPQNPDKYLELRNKLITQCTEFTGFCSEIPPLKENINSLIEFFKLSDYSEEKNLKLLFFAKSQTLKTFMRLKMRGICRTVYDSNYMYSKFDKMRISFKYKTYFLLSNLLKSKKYEDKANQYNKMLESMELN